MVGAGQPVGVDSFGHEADEGLVAHRGVDTVRLADSTAPRGHQLERGSQSCVGEPVAFGEDPDPPHRLSIRQPIGPERHEGVKRNRGAPSKPRSSRCQSNACTMGDHAPTGRRTVSPTRRTGPAFLPPRSTSRSPSATQHLANERRTRPPTGFAPRTTAHRGRRTIRDRAMALIERECPEVAGH